MNDLEQTMQWLTEAIQDDVEGVRATVENRGNTCGRLSWIKDGVVYVAYIEKVATRISGPGPEASVEAPLNFIEQLRDVRQEAEFKAACASLFGKEATTFVIEPPQDSDAEVVSVGLEGLTEIHGEITCMHGTERGQFCKACDEEPE